MEIKDRLRCELTYDRKDWWIDVTDLFQKIIGDAAIKVEVYFCTFGYPENENDIIKFTESLIPKYEKMINNSGMVFDGDKILFTFANGRKLELEVSEFLGIS